MQNNFTSISIQQINWMDTYNIH